MTDNIITQVSQETYQAAPAGYEDNGSNVDYDSKIHLDVRGTPFTITRDELMSLPESILLCLFPNGVFLDANGNVISNLTEEDVVHVNFDPSCFEYISSVFGEAQRDLQDLLLLLPQISAQSSPKIQQDSAHVLQNKPAIIVLREDLDYYVIPPVAGLNADQMRHLKITVADHLLHNNLIFLGLGFDPKLDSSVHQALGPAEQHLFDMLCTSGFEKSETWGSRTIEPSKCVVLLLLLVRLRTHEPTPPELPSLQPVASNASGRSRSRFATLANSASRAASRSLSKVRKAPDTSQSKLLLFWRKPARKCWWSNQSVAVDMGVKGLFEGSEKTMTVKVHIRRVWTLELLVVGVQ